MFNSLRTRLTLIFVGLTIVPLMIVGFLIADRGHNTLQDQSVVFQGELAERTAINLEAFFGERQAELFALTNIYGLDTLDISTQRDVLLTLLSEQPAYYQVVLVNEEADETIRITRGEVVTDNDLTSRSDDEIYQSAVTTRQIAYGAVYFNEEARDRFVTVAVPMEDLFTGEIGNVLMAEIRFQNVSDAVLRNLDLGPDEDVYIVNPDGVILAHNNPNLVIRETVFNIPEREGRYTGLMNSDAIIGMNTISLANQQFIVVAETSYENATALADDLSEISAIITITTLVFAVAVVTWVVSRVVNPIIGISQVAKAVQGGDLSARASEEGKGEIAVLGQAFNKMTDELQSTLDGLQENVTQLEASNKERETLIDELQIAKRLADENSRLKSEFLATMSHELRTPLNAIEGFTSIMLSGMGIELSARAEDMVKRVSSNSKRLLHLINDFLDLSRIEAGRLELVKAPITPRQLATKWQNEVGILAEEKGLDFEVKISPDLPEKILGDEDALSKIVINLLSNAFKFTHKGQVSLNLTVENDNWSIAVSDTGIGIPPHAREYIFDEFRQVDGSSKRLYGGTGLGLSLVQKMARAMGGNVAVQSELGQGSIFSVTLPLLIVEESPEGAIA